MDNLSPPRPENPPAIEGIWTFSWRKIKNEFFYNNYYNKIFSSYKGGMGGTFFFFTV